jgi:putative ABC transport system ATP-binding protein
LNAAPVITAQNISHAYGVGAERREVLRSLDLTVSAGEVVVLTGASGAGKTTLLTLCGALRSVQQGELQVLGNDLRGLNQEQQRNLRSSIGFIFQSHNLLEALTAGQNVVMSLLGRVPIEAAGELAEAALNTLGLAARIDAFPEELSGGEKQRVAVARALIRKPFLILADEPTASLDDASATVVKESIRQVAKSTACAVLLVTHDARVFDIADRVLQLVEGAIVNSSEHSIPIRSREDTLSP